MLMALFASALAASHAFAQTASGPLAQQKSPDEELVSLEAVVVTGSNIRRTDAETALPVSVFDMTDLDLRGGSTLAELFETMGIAEPTGLSEINTGPQGARGDVYSIDLRGIGSGSTLVLINGRRMAPHPISMAENGVPSLAPSLSAVPRALVGKVEVLRDGASAIYGADAAAGVVNNLVSRTYEGRNLSVRHSQTERGGAGEFQVTASQGMRLGGTHVSVAFDYMHRDDLRASQRDWASQSDIRLSRALPAPWNGLPMIDANGSTVRDNDFDSSSAVNRWGQWQRGFIQSDWTSFVGSRPTGNAGIVTSTTPSTTATLSSNGTFFLFPAANGDIKFKQTAPSRNIDNEEHNAYANWAQWRVLVPRTDRYQAALFFDRPLKNRMEVFGDVLFYHGKSITGREPVNWDDGDEPGIYLPASNPYNPFGTRFYHPSGAPNADGTPRLVGTPADIAMVGGVTPAGLKPRVIEVMSNAYRGLLGLKGRFGDTWEWETGLLYSGAQTHEYEYFYMRESWLRQALARTDATALNPFPCTFKIVGDKIVTDRPYQNPESLWASLYDTDERYGRTQLFLWDARASGRLWRLFGGGDLGLASGMEVRRETYEDHRPPYSGMNPPGSENLPFMRDNDNDFIALSPNVGISAQQTIFAVYSEVALPFVTRANRRLFLEGLELTLAGRYEHFSIFGQTAKPKASLVWKPTRWAKLRASVNQSFRAPNLVQTNTAALRRMVSATDYYRSEVTGLATDGAVNRKVFRQGNQNLKPENAQSWVAGGVVEVPGIRGLSFTFDYWSLHQKNVIENVGAPGTLQRDELALDQAVQRALAAGTPIDKIDLGSGTAAYQGYKTVTRAPVSDADRAAFAAYNAKQTSNAAKRAPVGEFVSLIDDYINLSSRKIEGYELGMQWRLPKFRFGQLTLAGDSTHYVRRENTTEDGGAPISSLERNGRAKWRASGSLTWKYKQWTTAWFTSYYGSFVDTSASTTEAVTKALGYPSYIKVFDDNGIQRYLLRVNPVTMHNVNLTYRFATRGRSLLKGVTLRGGINNLLDAVPPIVDETNAYQGGTANTRGRQYWCEIAKAF